MDRRLKYTTWLLCSICAVGCAGKDQGEKYVATRTDSDEGCDSQREHSAVLETLRQDGDSDSYKETVSGPQKVTILTYDVLPPYAYRNEKGELTGIYIEIAKTAFSRMPDYSVSLKTVPWPRAKIEIEKGRAFGILPPYFHAHDWLTQEKPHRPYIWPYSMPLYTQKDVIICNRRVLEKPRPRYPDDYKGLDFVMWRGDGRAGPEFERLARSRHIKLDLVENVENTVKFLLLERADCTIASRATFSWYLERLKKSDEYKQRAQEVSLEEAKTISMNEGYLGYTDINAEKNYPFKKDFSIKFDIEIYKMRRSGEIQRIVDSFLNHQ